MAEFSAVVEAAVAAAIGAKHMMRERGEASSASPARRLSVARFTLTWAMVIAAGYGVFILVVALILSPTRWVIAVLAPVFASAVAFVATLARPHMTGACPIRRVAWVGMLLGVFPLFSLWFVLLPFLLSTAPALSCGTGRPRVPAGH